MEESQDRLIRLSAQAEDDLAEIYSHTAHHWGEAQAERYAEFLLSELTASLDTRLSRPVQGRPGLEMAFAKWPKAQHGHYIIFSREGESILVVRVLHSAMSAGLTL